MYQFRKENLYAALYAYDILYKCIYISILYHIISVQQINKERIQKIIVKTLINRNYLLNIYGLIV